MASLLLKLPSACLLLLSIFHRFEAVVVTYNTTLTAGSLSSDEFYATTWNYTVSPESRDGGVFKILKLNLTDSSLIFFNWSYYGGACPEKMENVSLEDVVKVYDVTTKIGEGDPPDTFTLKSGSVLCFMKLERRQYGDNGEFVYTYKEIASSDPGVPVTHPLSFRYRVQYWLKSVQTKQCISIRSGGNLAFQMMGGMGDRKSLNNVRVFYTDEQYSTGTGGSSAQKTVLELTSRTPASSYERAHVLPWGDSQPKRICFAYEVVNGSSADFKDSVTFLATEFRTCNANMTEPSGLFTTDLYPKPLYSGVNCTIHITALPGQRISLSFLDAEIDCNHGFVMLRGLQNSPTTYNKMLLCGSALHGDNSASYVSESNTLSLQLMNRGYKTTDRGYFARYTAIGCGFQDANLPPHSRILNDNVDYIPPGFIMIVGCEQGYVFPTMKSEMTLECREDRTWSRQVPFCVESPYCNTILTAPKGTIESPSYPNEFSKNTTCVWKIRVKKGQNIKVTITDMSAFCRDNFLLLDSVSKASPGDTYERKFLCGKRDSTGPIGESFYTGDNELTVIFQSNFLKDSGYFKIKYEATGCSMEEFPTDRYKITKYYYNYYNVGSRLEFTCPYSWQYMIMTGESKHYLTCRADGKWNGTFPLCGS